MKKLFIPFIVLLLSGCAENKTATQKYQEILEREFQYKSRIIDLPLGFKIGMTSDQAEQYAKSLDLYYDSESHETRYMFNSFTEIYVDYKLDFCSDTLCGIWIKADFERNPYPANQLRDALFKEYQRFFGDYVEIREPKDTILIIKSIKSNLAIKIYPSTDEVTLSISDYDLFQKLLNNSTHETEGLFD